MAGTVDVLVPDIGDFADVPVVEVLVSEGDELAAEDPILVLESDKASMEVPAPQGGTLKELTVSVGDKVSEGDVLAVLEVAEAPDSTDASAPADAPAPAPAPAPAVEDEVERGDEHAGVLVLGSGPGGYTAAFRAADLGLDVVLVERHERLGGVCLNVGCIPSKALLHTAKLITDAEAAAAHGISFGEPQLDVEGIRAWKEEVVAKLTGGLGAMAKQRKVRVVRGTGRFTSSNMLEVEGPDGAITVSFDNAIIAAGSRAAELPGLPYDDERLMDSTGALELDDVPGRLLVIGGGIIGLEMATVYDALGSAVTVVELADQLIPGCDPDLVKPLHKRISGRYEGIHLKTSVEAIEAAEGGLRATFAGDDAPEPAEFDRVLVAVGRVANGGELGLDALGVEVGERGVVEVDEQRRTNVGHVFAIGDLTPGPMLAHKATHEAAVAAEVIAGENVAFDVAAIPSVAYTDPEVAWVGLTETEAKAEGTTYEKAVFPWSALGRALSMDAGAGLTKLLFDPESRRVLGAGIVGANAGELVAEVGLAIEMGAEVGDVALTVHAHPTLSEATGLAAEVAEGTVTDLPPKRR